MSKGNSSTGPDGSGAPDREQSGFAETFSRGAKVPPRGLAPGRRVWKTLVGTPVVAGLAVGAVALVTLGASQVRFGDGDQQAVAAAQGKQQAKADAAAPQGPGPRKGGGAGSGGQGSAVPPGGGSGGAPGGGGTAPDVSGGGGGTSGGGSGAADGGSGGGSGSGGGGGTGGTTSGGGTAGESGTSSDVTDDPGGAVAPDDISSKPSGQTRQLAGSKVLYSAIAGPGCPTPSRGGYKEQGYYRDGSKGWYGLGGGSTTEGGCNGKFTAVPMSGDKNKDNKNRVMWWWEPGAAAKTCTVHVYVPKGPNDRDVAGQPTKYHVLTDPFNRDSKYGSFTVDQSAHRGSWQSGGTFAVKGGKIGLKLLDRGDDWSSGRKLAHHAAAPVKITCNG